MSEVSDNEKEENKMLTSNKKRKSKSVETIETVVIALVLAVFIRATVAEARYIPSESMLPTLKIQDRLVVEKISNYTGIPKRGDVLVFYPPFAENDMKEDLWSKTTRWLGFTKNVAYIKRTIGLPGETVEVRDGTVFINGKPLDESAYIKEKPNYEMPPIKLKDDEIFMFGDNRNNSMDSHAWGPLPLKNVIGHAVIRFWPPTRIGIINTPEIEALHNDKN